MQQNQNVVRFAPDTCAYLSIMAAGVRKDQPIQPAICASESPARKRRVAAVPRASYRRRSYPRWSGVRPAFARILDALVSEATDQTTIMIDAIYLKAHRTASSLREKKGSAAD